MPRIPDVQSLGARGAPSIDRPGVGAPTPDMVEQEGAGVALQEVGAQLGQVASRIQRREDTISRVQAQNQAYEKASEQYRAQLTAGGFGDKQSVLEYRQFLDQTIRESLSAHRGSPDSLADLATELDNMRLDFVQQAAGASIVAQDKFVRQGIANRKTPVLETVLQNPADLPNAFANINRIFDDYADALTPEDEIEERNLAYNQVSVAAVESFLAGGDVESAREILAVPGVAESLSPEQMTSISSNLQRFEFAKRERDAERQRRLEDAAFALNVPVDQLPTWARAQAVGFEVPQAPGRPKAQSDFGRLIQDRQMFVEQYGESSPQVAAFDEMARAERADPTLEFDDVTKLRTEFSGLSKDFVQVRDAYKRVTASAAEPSAAGDLALIFNYMKILDPGSAVREGEFATAQNAQGIPGRIRSAYNNAISGERLTEETRADFISRAEELFKSQLESHVALEEDYRKRAERANVESVDDVIIDFVGPLRSERPRGEQNDEEATTPSAGDVRRYDLQGNPIGGAR